MFCRLSCAIALAIVVVAVSPGAAQVVAPPAESTAPAHIAVVEGAAVLERNGAGEAAIENLPLLEGDRLRTEAGRLEVILPDGSVLDLDRNTTVDLLAGGLVRLMAGRLIFVVSSPVAGGTPRDYRVDAPAGSGRFSHPGEYRVLTQVSNGQPFLELAVVRGRAVLEADGQPVPLSAGERAQAALGVGVTATGTFNSALTDGFVEWAEQCRSQRLGVQSNAYLPPELQVYGGSFDRDGAWDRSDDHGWVWYPRVDAGWRPYYDGGWYPYDWGWTWVAGGRWVWPTHHYGRWGYGTRGWYWAPGAVWGPAWVSWGFSGDFVSWCPLGWNDAPVFGFSFGLSFGYANPWRGWTVVPHHAFARGQGYRVQPYALRGDHLRSVERARFDVGRNGPTVSRHPAGRPSTAQERPRATERAWSTGGASPYTRAEAVARERTPAGQGIERPALGSAVPRSTPSRPSESRSPYYYLGPSASRPQQAPLDRSVPASPRLPGDRGRAADERDSRELGASTPAVSPGSTWPASRDADPLPGGLTSPRTPRGEVRPSPSPSPSPYSPSSSSSAPTRSYPAPDRSAHPRAGDSPAPDSRGGRSPGASPSASAPSRGAGPSGGAPSGGISGGRTPGRTPSGSGNGGGARGGRGRGGR